MQLNEIQTFLAIVETGSLVRASARLNVTQSTVTARLKSLENELGQTLIVRNKSGASLTAAGEKLRRYASTISDLWRQARQETALPDALNTVCNIGCEPDLWEGVGQRFFDRIRESLPQVALSVWQGSGQELGRWQRSGLIDVAFTHLNDRGQGQITTQLGSDPLILVSTRKDGPIRFDPGYVYVELGEAFGREHAIAYADAGIARLSFGTAELAIAHILTHGGSAYLPERLAAKPIAEGLLFKLEDAPVFKRNIYVSANAAAIEPWPWFEDVTSWLEASLG